MFSLVDAAQFLYYCASMNGDQRRADRLRVIVSELGAIASEYWISGLTNGAPMPVPRWNGKSVAEILEDLNQNFKEFTKPLTVEMHPRHMMTTSMRSMVHWQDVPERRDYWRTPNNQLLPRQRADDLLVIDDPIPTGRAPATRVLETQELPPYRRPVHPDLRIPEGQNRHVGRELPEPGAAWRNVTQIHDEPAWVEVPISVEVTFPLTEELAAHEHADRTIAMVTSRINGMRYIPFHAVERIHTRALGRVGFACLGLIGRGLEGLGRCG